MVHQKLVASTGRDRPFQAEKQSDRVVCKKMMEKTVKLKLSCYCEGCQRMIVDCLKHEGGVRKVEVDEGEGVLKVIGEGLDAEHILRTVKKVKSWAELAQGNVTDTNTLDRFSSPEQKPASPTPSPAIAAVDSQSPPPAPIPSKPPPLHNLTLITERSFELDNWSRIRTRVVTTPDSHTCIRVEETRFRIDKFSHHLLSFPPAASS